MDLFDRDAAQSFDSIDLAEWGVPGAPPALDGHDAPPPPVAREPREPRRHSQAAPARGQNGLPWSVVGVAMGTLVALTLLQLAAMTMGASQGTTAAYLLSGALTAVFVAPLIAGRLWWERNRDT